MLRLLAISHCVLGGADLSLLLFSATFDGGRWNTPVTHSQGGADYDRLSFSATPLLFLNVLEPVANAYVRISAVEDP